jgi:hypothetical protein
MKVGTRVGYRIGETVREGVVIEDRGDLGVHGEQIVGVRVLVDDQDGGDFETETSVLRLVEPPTESVVDQLRRLDRRERAELRKARRAAKV